MKRRKSVYQEGTAPKVVNGIDSSKVFTSHLILACVKELSVFFRWICGAKRESHIHSLYLALVETYMVDNMQEFCTARGVSTISVSEIFGFRERAVRIGYCLCSAPPPPPPKKSRSKCKCCEE